MYPWEGAFSQHLLSGNSFRMRLLMSLAGTHTWVNSYFLSTCWQYYTACLLISVTAFEKTADWIVVIPTEAIFLFSSFAFTIYYLTLFFFSVQLSFFGASQQIQFCHLPTSENPRREWGMDAVEAAMQFPGAPGAWGSAPSPTSRLGGPASHVAICPSPPPLAAGVLWQGRHLGLTKSGKREVYMEEPRVVCHLEQRWVTGQCPHPPSSVPTSCQADRGNPQAKSQTCRRPSGGREDGRWEGRAGRGEPSAAGSLLSPPPRSVPWELAWDLHLNEIQLLHWRDVFGGSSARPQRPPPQGCSGVLAESAAGLGEGRESWVSVSDL